MNRVKSLEESNGSIATLEHPALSKSNGNGKKPAEAKKVERISIPAPKMRTVIITIKGTSPLLQCAFPQKAQNEIREKHSLGDIGTQNKRKRKDPRDFIAEYEGSMHHAIGKKGVVGVPCSAFRSAMISACRIVGFMMTKAKLSVFVPPVEYDSVDGTPLVPIIGKPEKHEMMGRNDDGGVNLRVRAIFRDWKINLPIMFDEDQFTLADIVNLLAHAGMKVGIGDGRHDSKNSNGMGMGCFEIVANPSSMKA